jgi:hypothetical protein
MIAAFLLPDLLRCAGDHSTSNTDHQGAGLIHMLSLDLFRLLDHAHAGHVASRKMDPTVFSRMQLRNAAAQSYRPVLAS